MMQMDEIVDDFIIDKTRLRCLPSCFGKPALVQAGLKV